MKFDLYQLSDHDEWNDFVSQAKNSHFIFNRDFMEYHSDRFTDFSVIARDDKGNIIAVLPANLSNRTLHSHQGLSFGGLCVRKNATTNMVLDIFKSLILFLRSTNLVDDFVYKRLPDFYTNYPAQEDLYALFRLGANLYRRDVSVAVDLYQPLPISNMRRRHVNKATKNNVQFYEENDLTEFWNLLTCVLQKQHRVHPVHSLYEINNLMHTFPKNIKCFSARKDGMIIAGTIVFETASVAHTQYLANGRLGRELGGLDLVISKLIEKYSSTKKYLNLGISSEEEGTFLNEGLISQKEGFGARALVHDFFRLSII